MLRYTYRPFASRVITQIDTVQNYIAWSENNFIKFLTDNNICTELECKAWEPLKVVDSRECEALLRHHLVYLIRLDKLHSASEGLHSCFEKVVDGANALVDGRPLIFHTVDSSGKFRKEAFEVLVKCGANANPSLGDDFSLFSFVILHCPKNKDAIRTLVEHGADPNSSHSGGPLIKWTFNDNQLCLEDSLDKLIELGADVNVVYAHKRLIAHAFDNDCCFNEVAFYKLVNAGADVSSMLYYTFDDKDSFNSRAFEALIKAGATADDFLYDIPMISYVFDENGDVNSKAFDALVAAGADSNVKYNGLTFVCDFISPDFKENALDLLFAHGAQLPDKRPEQIPVVGWEKAIGIYKKLQRNIQSVDSDVKEDRDIYVKRITREKSANLASKRHGI